MDGVPSYHDLLSHHASTVALPSGRWGWGLKLAEKAQEVASNDVETANALSDQGVFLDRLGYYGEGIKRIKQAISLNDRSIYWSNLAVASDHNPATTNSMMRDIRGHLRAAIGSVPRMDEAPLDSMPDIINIGYVSGDFRNHSAASCFLSLIDGFDTRRFKLFLFSSTRGEDAMTAAFRKVGSTSGGFFDLPDDDDEAARLIRSKGIHILVDLSGVSGLNRLPVFARRPAPIQITGWGYATSTGLPEIDYFMACNVSVPDSDAEYFSEALCRVSRSTHFHFPEAKAMWPEAVRAKGPKCFGWLGRVAKVSDDLLRVWAEILRRRPDALLCLKDTALDSEMAVERIVRIMTEEGIDAETRVYLGGATSRHDHVLCYNSIDVALDSWPENGGATTMECLMSGVPMVTMPGNLPGGRGGKMILEYAGFKDWVARDAKDYVEIALSLMDKSDLHDRRSVQHVVTNGKLSNQAGYLREIEGHYTRMVELRAAGGKPNWIEWSL